MVTAMPIRARLSSPKPTCLSAKNYMTITDATSATTTRELGDLVKKCALRRTDDRRATRYWLDIPL